MENPFAHEQLFERRTPAARRPLLVDIYHPVVRLRDELSRVRDPRVAVFVNTWDADDPLADVMRIMLGSVPPTAESGMDYQALLQTTLGATVERIAPDAPLPVRAQPAWVLSNFSRAFMERHYAVTNNCRHPGFYVGSAGSFHDLVTFWNLRATDISLVFYDPAHASRLDPQRAEWRGALDVKRRRTFDQDRRRRVDHPLGCGDAAPRLEARSAA